MRRHARWSKVGATAGPARMRRAGQEMGEDLGEDVEGLVEEAFAEEAGRERSGE